MDFEKILDSVKMNSQQLDGETLSLEQCGMDYEAQSTVTACGCRQTDVRFCCVKDIPGFITAPLTTSGLFPRIAYDPNCLSCVVEPCVVDVPCPDGTTQTFGLFAAKIVGCMPYQIETRYAAQSPSNICPDPLPDISYSIVCVDSARFNNAVCFGCQKEMEAVCAQLNALLRRPSRCALIQAISPVATPTICPNSGGRYVIFTGLFRINFTCP